MAVTTIGPSPDVAGLSALPVNLIDEAFGVVWRAFGRRTMVDAWHLGVELRRIKDGRGRTFSTYCESIGMDRSWAYRLLKISDAPKEEVWRHATVEGAIKAIKAAAPSPPPPPPEPAPEVVEHPVEHLHPHEHHPVVEPAPEVVVEPDHEAVIEAVAAEEERANPPVPVIVDEESEIQRLRRRHKEDVQTINAGIRREQALKLKNRDIRDALVSSPGCPNCEEVLARFWSVARKKA